MDIFSFVDSRDIRVHLQEINYEFTIIEAAFLIHHSRLHSLKDKLVAFQELIDTTPDCSLENRHLRCGIIKSFHDFLREYIALQNKKLDAFFKDTGAVYQHSIYESHEWLNGCYDWSESADIFADYETCLADAADDENNDPARQILIYKSPLLRDIDLHSSKKPYRSSLRLNAANEVMEIDLHDFPTKWNGINVDHFLEDMCISIPTPFHCGDIVTNLYHPDEPYVLESIRLWDSKKRIAEGYSLDEQQAKKQDDMVKAMLESGDDSEMTYYAYHWKGDELGLLRDDSWSLLYLSLEKYRKPLEGSYRVLLPVSNAIKKAPDIDAELLCNTFYLLRDEARIAALRKEIEHTYIEDALKKTGVHHDN